MIYYLHDDPEICAQMLADDDLENQIKAIAQTLANVHYLIKRLNNEAHLFIEDYGLPLPPKHDHDLFSLWGKLCRANYLKLVDMGLACCEEYTYRFSDARELAKGTGTRQLAEHEIQEVIEFARDNVPERLPQEFTVYARHEWNGDFPPERPIYHTTPFPLCVPNEYTWHFLDKPGEHNLTILSYRNYYKSKLPKDAKFTHRTKPEWL